MNRKHFIPDSDTLENRCYPSLFTPIVTPISGATQASTGVASISSALTAHAVSDQNPVNQILNHLDPLPNSMDPVEGSNTGDSSFPNPMDPATSGNLRLHSVNP